LRLVNPEGPDPSSVIGVSCFIVAPPFRRHRIAARLLDRVIADAAARGASWVEAYPHNEPKGPECQHFFRGPRSLFEAPPVSVASGERRRTPRESLLATGGGSA